MKVFPFKSSLTLDGVIAYWVDNAAQDNKIRNFLTERIADYLREHPELTGILENPAILEDNCDFVECLMSAVIAPANQHSIAAAYVPFTFNRFYQTEGYNRLIEKYGSEMALIEGDITEEEINDQKTIGAYAEILRTFYATDIAIEKPILLKGMDPETGIHNFYKVEYNGIFCKIVAREELPELTQEQIQELVANPYDLSRWNSLLPYHLFEFTGFTVYTLIDVTSEESTSSIKENLLKKNSLKEEETFRLLEDNFRSLIGLKDLRIGISGFNNSQSCFVDYKIEYDVSSRMDIADLNCKISQQSFISRFKENNDPIIINSVEDSEFSPEIKGFFLRKNIKSLVICPLYYENRFIGVLEMGSPKVGELSSLATTKIREILPLLSIALKRSTEEEENRVQAVIKEKYTSIHPTVEWRFLNAAHKIVAQQDQGYDLAAEGIVFKDVYPLYGASDIRGSSEIRSNAIKEDLYKQLNTAGQVLKEMFTVCKYPFMEELEFQVTKMMKRISKGMFSGDETTVITFLRNELEPVFRTLEQERPELAEAAAKYWSILDPDLEVVYEARRDFELSLTAINSAISNYLEEQQPEAQSVFPHYFEKYKSDGVEFNMYIGQSLTNERDFHPIYARNLKIWQLITMSEIAMATSALGTRLPISLETTHLILVHNSTLSVEFRMDEKVFDVDGAYNMRYEIVKKRIDKALVNGTEERITQPGKITIVYSGEKDAEEYLSFIEFMQSKGYLTDEVEHLEVEPLQGVRGLKALRVTVDQDTQRLAKELEKIKFRDLVETK